MAFKLAEAYVELSQRGLTGVGRAVDGINRRFDGLLGGVRRVTSALGPLGTAMAAVGAAGGVAGMLKLAASAEQTAVSFEVMLGSAEKAKKMVAEIEQFGAVTPFSSADLANAAKVLLNFGVAADEIMPTLDRLSNVAAGDAQKLGSLALVFGQISANGRLTGGDLLQLVNTGFNPLNEIAKKTGETMPELRKRMEQGKIGIDEVRQAFVDATSKGGLFYQMNEKQSRTLAGVFSTLQDAVMVTLRSIGEELVKGFDLKGATVRFTGWIEKNKGAMVEFAKTVLGNIADAAKAVWEVFRATLPVLKAVGSAFASIGVPLGKLILALGLTAKAIGVVRVAFAAMIAHPVVAAIAGITVAVMALSGAFSDASAAAAENASRASAVRQEQDALRAKHQEMFARLQELSKQQRLNSDEMDEARKLVKQLSAAYGDLGIVLDATAGKITGVSEAQAKANAQMRAVAEKQLRAEKQLLSVEFNEANRRKQKAVKGDLFGNLDVAGRDRAQAEMEVARSKVAAINARLALLKAGGEDAISGRGGAATPDDPATAASTAAAQKMSDLRAQYEKMQAEMSDKEKSELDRRIDAVREWSDQYHKALGQAMAAERELAKQRGQDPGMVNPVQTAIEEQIGEMEGRALDALLAKKREKEDAGRLAAEEAIQDRIGRLRIEATAKGADKERKLLELERQKALADAKKKGVSADLVNEEFDLRLAAVGQQESPAARGGQSFGLADLAGNMQSMALQKQDDKQVRAIEKGNSHLEEIKTAVTHKGIKVDPGVARAG